MKDPPPARDAPHQGYPQSGAVLPIHRPLDALKPSQRDRRATPLIETDGRRGFPLLNGIQDRLVARHVLSGFPLSVLNDTPSLKLRTLRKVRSPTHSPTFSKIGS